MIKTYLIKDEVYGSWLWLVYNYNTSIEVNDWFKKKYKVPEYRVVDNQAGTFFCLENKDNGVLEYFVCVRNKKVDRTVASRINTLMHECFHAGHRILRDKGIDFCKESEEAFAYFIDSIFYDCLTELYPKLKKKELK